MRSHARRRFGVCLGAVFLLMHGFGLWTAKAQPQTTPRVFFSQGKAIYSPQDPSKSQHEAVQDFLALAVTQAMSAFLSPAQLEQYYQRIQEEVLRQSDRYVQSYEVFSENPGQDGLYRVTGQVTVSMELLKKDLLALGLTRPEVELSQASVSTPGPEGSLSNEAAAKVAKADETAGKASASGQEILWAVPEKWDQEWHLPGDLRDPEGRFAANVFRESRDYDWSIRMPQKGTLAADGNGEMSQSEVLDQAAALGLPNVVVGKIGLSTSGDSEVRADAALRLLNTASGKVQGEIHKELAVGDLSNNEAARELAALVVPQLDLQLRESSQSVSVNGSPAEPEEAGELVVQIKSTDAYAAWLLVEKMLREHFQNLSVKGLEIRPKECIVRLLGADGTSLKKLNGTRLSNGAQVQITSLGTGDHSFGVSVARSEGSPVEPSQ